ncbi:hypothetical protein PMAYCL1PPCAC_23062, partial [Pristionchus mayeri]
FPFLDLQPYVPVVIDETAIIYKCDLLITAPEGSIRASRHISQNLQRFLRGNNELIGTSSWRSSHENK